MINSLTGKVIDAQSQLITLDVNGIGFGVAVADEFIYTKNQQYTLDIYFHWSQDNGPQLFGFSSALAKKVFMLTIGCSGIGPKMGMSILNQMPPEQFIQAIALADAKALSALNGIGAKKAEMLVMQLRDKVAKLAPEDFSSADGAPLRALKDVTDALVSLNYSRQEIGFALEYVKKEVNIATATFDEILRKGLSYLAKNR